MNLENQANPINTLFIESGKHGGGSFQSQFDIISNLDREKIRPHVLFSSKTIFFEKLQSLEIPVQVAFSPFHSVNSPELLERICWRIRKAWHISTSAGLAATSLACMPYIRRIHRIIHDHDIRLIHTINNPMMDFFMTRIPAVRAGRVAYVCHLQDVSAFPVPKHLMNTHVDLTNKYIAISQCVADFWISRSIPANKITVIPNFISLHEPSTHSDLRSGLGIPANATVVMGAGRFVEWKRFDLLISAHAKISKERKDIHLVIIGKGPLKESLESQIKSSGCPNIHLLDWRDDLLSDLGESDIFVLPSDSEPFGIILLEAMGQGTPVIASRSGGPRDFIVNGENGLHFQPGDSADLAAKILDLTNNTELQKKISSRALQDVKDTFSATVQVPRIQDILLDSHREIRVPG